MLSPYTANFKQWAIRERLFRVRVFVVTSYVKDI